VQFGAQRKLTDEQAQELRQRRENRGLIRDLMKAYGLSKATVYRYLDDTS
jgi:DNA invertase Pin-like site-specific DNA recombinase